MSELEKMAERNLRLECINAAAKAGAATLADLLISAGQIYQFVTAPPRVDGDQPAYANHTAGGTGGDK